MVVTPDATYEISFAGAPAGVYKYYCLPHLQLGMVAMVMVES
jgi:plastocyanin